MKRNRRQEREQKEVCEEEGIKSIVKTPKKALSNAQTISVLLDSNVRGEKYLCTQIRLFSLQWLMLML